MDKFFAFVKKYYSNIWVRNGVFISIIIILNLLVNSVQDAENYDHPFAIIVSLLLNFLTVVFHNHIALRLYLFEGKVLKYIGLFLIFMVAVTVASKTLFPWILDDAPKTNILDIVTSILFNMFIAFLIYFFHYYFLKYIKITDIEILNQKTEIENLKKQLNPHFLFNSLNNLYGVALSSPSDVPNKIIELTDLLKYQIETSKQDYSSLEAEKDFIEKYISYSKWKLQNLTINSTKSGEMKNYQVTPMIFLPLVENAIKYANFERNPIINIQWIFSETKLEFSISNAFKYNESERFSTKSGLTNLKKRLELFHPAHSLQIEELNNNFTVSITLWNLNIHA